MKTISDLERELDTKLRKHYLTELQDLKRQEWVLHQKLAKYWTKTGLNLYEWWLEYGAFICQMPRRSGKSTLLVSLANDLVQRSPVFVAAGFADARNLLGSMGLSSRVSHLTLPFQDKLKGVSGGHLFVDEYTFLGGAELAELLNHNWDSVSLFGTHVFKAEQDFTGCFVMPSKQPLSAVSGYREKVFA